jgi:hypothetical protein
MSITAKTSEQEHRAEMEDLEGDDLFTQAEDKVVFLSNEEKDKKAKTRKAREEQAKHLAQMHGGTIEEWIRDLTPHGKWFSDDRAIQLGFRRVAEHTYTGPDGTVLYQHPNLGFHDLMEATVDPCPGVPIGCRSPRKRGPYSTPKHTLMLAATDRSPG